MHFDNSDPMKPAPISSRLYTGEIRQFDKPIRSNSRAEPPSLGVTGFEIRERLAADRVDEDVTRLTVESFSGTGKAAAEHFELSGIHKHAIRRSSQTGTPTATTLNLRGQAACGGPDPAESREQRRRYARAIVNG